MTMPLSPLFGDQLMADYQNQETPHPAWRVPSAHLDSDVEENDVEKFASYNEHRHLQMARGQEADLYLLSTPTTNPFDSTDPRDSSPTASIVAAAAADPSISAHSSLKHTATHEYTPSELSSVSRKYQASEEVIGAFEEGILNGSVSRAAIGHHMVWFSSLRVGAFPDDPDSDDHGAEYAAKLAPHAPPLEIVECGATGHCLFQSVAGLLDGDPALYQQYRDSSPTG
jgi:hypothetical protein